MTETRTVTGPASNGRPASTELDANPDGQSLYRLIVDDLHKIGADFRINDLNEALEVKWQGHEWRLMDDTLEAVIRTQLRELGYGIQGKGKATRTAVTEAWITLGDKQRYNPIKAYFDSIRHLYRPTFDHDVGLNTPVQIEKTLAGKLTNPDRYAGRWLFRWMTGAIARVYRQERNPMLVFVGEQEIGKSSFIRWLCPPLLREYFREGPIRPDNKDDRLRLADTFIQEVGELGSTTRRADVDALKNYITEKEIFERPPYGKRPMKKPAVCSFFGSVNYDGAGFLNDPTGSTRFLTCEINHIDFSYTQIDVNLLWSEALYFYEHHPRVWELPPKEKEARAIINQQFQLVNALEDVVLTHLEITYDPNDFMTTYEIRQHLATHYRYSSEKSFSMELAQVLKAMSVQRRRAAYTPNNEAGKRHPAGYEGVRRKLVSLDEP